MVTNQIGAVDDTEGRRIAVTIDGPQINLYFGDDWRTLDYSQASELIEYLDIARTEALIAEINAPHDEADNE
jgi:hypothetical protein